MKKQLFAILFFFLSIATYSQCPLSVQISSTPDLSVNKACKNAPIQLIATPSSGAIVTQYVWVTNGDTQSSSINTLNLIANNQNVIVYMETVTGCSPDIVANSFQIKTANLTPTITYKKECNQPSADIQITTSEGNSPYTYDLIGSGISSDGFYNNVEIGNHLLYTLDDQGCKDTTLLIITSYKCDPPIPSEMITPNGDGFNDKWSIGNIQLYPDNKVYIYDRWGQRVYYKKGYNNALGWDATYLGVDMAVSAYFYIIKIKQENGEDITLKGPISVYR